MHIYKALKYLKYIDEDNLIYEHFCSNEIQKCYDTRNGS